MLSLVPPLMSFLSTSPLVRPAMHLSSLKTISGGAAPFGPTLIEKFRERCENDEVIFREGQSPIPFVVASFDPSSCA